MLEIRELNKKPVLKNATKKVTKVVKIERKVERKKNPTDVKYQVLGLIEAHLKKSEKKFCLRVRDGFTLPVYRVHERLANHLLLNGIPTKKVKYLFYLHGKDLKNNPTTPRIELVGILDKTRKISVKPGHLIVKGKIIKLDEKVCTVQIQANQKNNPRKIAPFAVDLLVTSGTNGFVVGQFIEANCIIQPDNWLNVATIKQAPKS